MPGAVLGTYLYMSPEQLAGRTVDERADLFSLGVMVVETLTGQRPFQGKTLAELHLAVLKEPFHLQGEAQEIRRLDAVLEKCLARDPKHRFASAADMQRELVPALRQCPPLAAPARPTNSDSATAVSKTTQR